jgi:hypothetical protein
MDREAFKDMPSGDVRAFAASEAGGQLDLVPEGANNDDIKHHSRLNQPKPGTPLMRRGLRIKGDQLWFEDAVIVPELGELGIPPSAVDRLKDLVDAIDGEPFPVRWTDANPPEG